MTEQTPREPLSARESAPQATEVVREGEGGEQAAGGREGPSRVADFDRDPAALAWAREKVQTYIDRLADFERQAKAMDDPATALGCGISRLLAQRHFLGDGGCTYGVFDERLPRLRAAQNAGPSVREAAADDRAYWERKDAGEDR
ncbi:hypothetical protein [Streptomyces sp. NPDC003395]